MTPFVNPLRHCILDGGKCQFPLYLNTMQKNFHPSLVSELLQTPRHGSPDTLIFGDSHAKSLNASLFPNTVIHAIPMDTTAMALPRACLVAALTPKHVVVVLGTNDVLADVGHWQNDARLLFAYLRAVFPLARIHTQSVFLGRQHTKAMAVPDHNAALRTIAIENGVEYHSFVPHLAWLRKDNVHLNHRGKIEWMRALNAWKGFRQTNARVFAVQHEAWETKHNVPFPGRTLGGRNPVCGQPRRSGHRGEWLAQYVRPGARGIEVGPCQLRTPLPPGAQTIIVDLFRDARLAAQCYGGALPEIDITDDAQTLSRIPDASYDFIVGNHVLEHMPDFALALHHWLRVVRPGGYTLFALPDMCATQWKTGEHLRLQTDAQHFVREFRSTAPELHDDEAAVMAWGMDMSHGGLQFAPSDVRRGMFRGGEEHVHRHTWTVDSAKASLLAIAGLPGMTPFEIVDVSRYHHSKYAGEEIRCVLRRKP